jgi:putative ABC transport system substrate-binding protein
MLPLRPGQRMHFDQLKRREFVTLLGGAAAWPIAARAQQQRRIGVLMNGVESDAISQGYVALFVQGLGRLGWIEGQNLHIDYRWNGGNAELARASAADLVKLAPDVILSSTTTNLKALQRLSPTIPIVFVQVSDPTTQGFVLNLAHPGGNITGFDNFEFTIGGKWLDLLRQLAPATARVAFMYNPQTSSQNKFFQKSIESAAFALGVNAIVAPVENIAEIERAIESLSREPNSGLIVPGDAFLGVHRKPIIAFAARYRVPAIYPNIRFVRDGGLISYGVETAVQYRQAAIYVDRIFKGAKPAELPIQAPTKFALGINLKTAKTLGIEVPLSLLLIADEQIE